MPDFERAGGLIFQRKTLNQQSWSHATELQLAQTLIQSDARRSGYVASRIEQQGITRVIR